MESCVLVYLFYSFSVLLTSLASNLTLIHTNQNTTEYLSTDSPDSSTKKAFFRAMTTNLSSTSKQETRINRDSTMGSNQDPFQKFGNASSMLFSLRKQISSGSQDASPDNRLESVLSLHEQPANKTSLRVSERRSLSDKSITALGRLQVILEHPDPVDDQREKSKINESSLEYPPEEVSEVDDVFPEKRVPTVSLRFQASPFSINLPI